MEGFEFKREANNNELFSTFYPEQHIVPLPEVLFTINRHCGFLESAYVIDGRAMMLSNI